MSVYRGVRGRNKADLEILSKDSRANVTQDDYDDLLNRVDVLERLNKDVINQLAVVNSVDNLLLNSDFSFSTLGYTGAGSATELYKWYYGASMANVITTATNPLWDNVSGAVVLNDITAAKDLSFNFDKRVILPGFTYYLTFLAKKADGGLTSTTKFYAGIYDSGATADYLTGKLVGDSTHPTPIVTPTGGTAATTYKYVVVAITDTNNVIVSGETTIVNGVAVLDATHYNNIKWSLTSGIISYYVFRTSGTPQLIATLPSGNTSYNDTGSNISAGSPPTATPPKAYIEIIDFGSTLTTSWQNYKAVIRVPGGYDLNSTATGNQWFRMHLDTVAPSSNIYVDRIGLSTLPGGWAASSKDVLATGDIGITPSGDGGAGGKGVDPYGDGGSGDFELP